MNLRIYSPEKTNFELVAACHHCAVRGFAATQMEVVILRHADMCTCRKSAASVIFVLLVSDSFCTAVPSLFPFVKFAMRFSAQMKLLTDAARRRSLG